jgi:hypothetical protein
MCLIQGTRQETRARDGKLRYTIKKSQEDEKTPCLKDARLVDLGDEGEGGLLDGPLLVLAGLYPLQVAVGFHKLLSDVWIRGQGVANGLAGRLKASQSWYY